MRMFVIVMLVFGVISSITPAYAGEVRAAVARSLRDAYNELANSFEQKSKGVKIVTQFGTSQALAKQIADGLPTDIFISAHQQWTDYLKLNGLLEELFLSTIASNTLVFVGNPEQKVNSVDDFRSLKRIAISNPATTAHGQYTMEALKNAGLEVELKDRLVIGKKRQNLILAEQGEVDGAIIYRTEANNLKKSKILFTFQPNLYTPISYQLALTKSGIKNHEALDFYKFLNSPAAKSILMRYGYIVR